MEFTPGGSPPGTYATVQPTFVQELGDWTAHDFACAVCHKPGECDGDCDRDPTAHVHFDGCDEAVRDV